MHPASTVLVELTALLNGGCVGKSLRSRRLKYLRTFRRKNSELYVRVIYVIATKPVGGMYVPGV